MDIKSLTNITSVLNTLKDSASNYDLEDLRAVTQNDKLDKSEKIKLLGKQFEKIFLSMVMKSMRDTVKSSDLFGKSLGEDVYRSMLDEEYVNQASNSLNLGFAEAFLRKFNCDDK